MKAKFRFYPVAIFRTAPGQASSVGPWLLAASIADLLFLYVPIAVLIVFSFNASRLSARWQDFTLQWYGKLFTDQALLAATLNSLIVATVSTVFAGILGVLTAVALERQPFRWQTAFEGLLLIPIVIPEIMMGVAMLLFFVMIKLPLSLVTMTIAHTVFNFPVVALIVRARLRKLDPRLEEAARDLGATPWVAFRRVTLPLLMPGIIGALLMAFTLSLDDFIISFFTAGVGSTTLPIKVYGMLKTAVTPEVNALSAILVLVSMTLVAAATWVQRR